MKPSDSDLEDLWQGIAYACEQRGQPVPAWLRLVRSLYKTILAGAWQRA